LAPGWCRVPGWRRGGAGLPAAGYCRVLPGAAGLLPGCEGVRALPGAAGCCRGVLAGCCRVLPGCRVAGLPGRAVKAPAGAVFRVLGG
jgi:hypothetical protein